ncbi:hypothetical protein INQ51_21080 [Maribellus sp. CM-23]|uniref:tetratricopeptide repeat protein n=1 Tax=Maribellus sp. CM-23 TaxID=2781026 RepID=UPI001F1D26A9|nr:hypothetical protein [Maribellus sp. CM-23]MCE4566829.1 hypothetical protein [Maribellus sp. CM-23]
MRLNKLLPGLLFILLIYGCGAPNVLTNAKTEAETYETAGNFVAALAQWKSFIESTPLEQIAGADFAKAAKLAFKAGDSETAKSWFDQARYKNFADAEMYQTLSEIYRSEGNLSKELSALESYSEKFGSDNATVNERLFQLYAEISSWEKANELWGKMNEASKQTENNLGTYLEVNKKLENNAICDSVATALLSLNPDQPEALDWLATKYYWAGQERYEVEIEKYERNKTRKQYALLLKELDQVTADFKKALPYLEKLWAQKPGKEYASYFVNIYARFGDEKKVDFYQKYLFQ